MKYVLFKTLIFIFSGLFVWVGEHFTFNVAFSSQQIMTVTDNQVRVGLDKKKGRLENKSRNRRGDQLRHNDSPNRGKRSEKNGRLHGHPGPGSPHSGHGRGGPGPSSQSRSDDRRGPGGETGRR